MLNNILLSNLIEQDTCYLKSVGTLSEQINIFYNVYRPTYTTFENINKIPWCKSVRLNWGKNAVSPMLFKWMSPLATVGKAENYFIQNINFFIKTYKVKLFLK